MPVFVIDSIWNSIPPITRVIIVISAFLSLLVSLDLVTSFKMYFNWQAIWDRGEYWRLITCLFY